MTFRFISLSPTLKASFARRGGACIGRKGGGGEGEGEGSLYKEGRE